MDMSVQLCTNRNIKRSVYVKISMTSFTAFCIESKKKITLWLQNMNFIFSWWKQYLIYSFIMFIHKILFSSVEDKIHIFVPHCNILYSMYTINIVYFQINIYTCNWPLLYHWLNAKNGLFMVLELNCMYREKKRCKAQYTYSSHKAQATKSTGSWFAVSLRKHLKYGLQYLANTHILYQRRDTIVDLNFNLFPHKPPPLLFYSVKCKMILLINREPLGGKG